MTTTPTPPMEDDVNQLRDELAASPTRIGWLRAHIDEQADSLCFNLSTHLGCEPSDDAVVDAVQSLIGQIDAQSVRLEAAERLAADRLEQMQADRKQALVWRDQAELYEQVRKFSPREFQALWTKNVTSGAMFDDLVRAAIASEATT